MYHFIRKRKINGQALDTSFRANSPYLSLSVRLLRMRVCVCSVAAEDSATVSMFGKEHRPWGGSSGRGCSVQEHPQPFITSPFLQFFPKLHHSIPLTCTLTSPHFPDPSPQHPASSSRQLSNGQYAIGTIFSSESEKKKHIKACLLGLLLIIAPPLPSFLCKPSVPIYCTFCFQCSFLLFSAATLEDCGTEEEHPRWITP